MPFLNPVHGLVVPFLCLFTIPMAIFAGITSALAFSLLMFRVAIVYVDIAMAFVPQFIKGRHYNHGLTDGEFSYARRLSSSRRGSYVSSRRGSGDNSPSAVVSPSPYYQKDYDAPHQRSPLRRKNSYGLGSARRRSRRSSQASISPTIAAIREDSEMIPPLPESGGLAPSVGIERDFEGVGGWRLNDSGDDDGWENINSRLELPMERCSSFGSRYYGLSHRSHSVVLSQSLEEGQGNGCMGGNTVSRKGTLRNGSGNGTSGCGYGGETQQVSWTGGRANRSASGSISKKLTALTPSGGGGKNHDQGNRNGPSPMSMLEQEQYFTGFFSQNGKWKPMA
ncbi:hypothetical protein QBC45DRAFT_144164 [Copromyces sp. CBS 386.78]|nr:hypothetical protein QBC45DRAFT_144164 [Copromyces sp. CBS 386.78]